MQQQRRLIVAAAVVAVMVVLVVVFGRQQAPTSHIATENVLWLPQLQTQIDGLLKLHLRSASESVTLVRKDGRWGVAERAGYAVKIGQLGELLESLAKAHRIEQKTSRPEYLDRLGLSDIEKPDSKAILIEGWSAAAEPLFRVMIGNEADGRAARYVRMAAENQAWLIDKSPQPLASATDWLDSTLLGLEFERVARVERINADDTGFVATRSQAAESSLTVAVLPEGKKQKYATVLDSVARALLTAAAEDVRPAGEIDFAAEQSARTSIAMVDGLQVAVTAIKKDDGNWMKLSISAVPVAAPAPSSAGEDKTEKAPAPHDSAAEAKALTARLDGWAYKVSDYVYGELSKPLADYIEDDKPEPAKPADASKP